MQKIISKAEELVSLFEDYVGSLPNLEDKDKILVVCSFSLFVKVIRTFKSIVLLCSNGLKEEAHCLVRVLCETTVLVLAINDSDSENRARQYFAYTHIVMEKNVGCRKNNLGDITPEIESLVKKQSDELRHELGSVAYDEMQTKTWKGIIKSRKCEDAFREVGHATAYDTMYRGASLNIHAEDFFNYIEWQDDQSWLLVGKNFKDIEKYVQISAIYSLLVMEKIQEKLFSGSENQVDRRKELNEYFSKFSS